MNAPVVQRVLVVKLSGFAEFVLAFGAFSAIRRHHANAYITLLTTPPYADLARRSGWFDEVWEDGEPRWERVDRVFKLVHRLRRAGLDRVYDLDSNARTARYRTWMRELWGSRAEWSYCGLDFLDRLRGSDGAPLHYVEQLVGQLAEAGVEDLPTPELSWLTTEFGGRYGLQDGFVLVATGGIQEGGPDGWPIKRFVELTRRIAIEGRRPVVIGTKSQSKVNQLIAAASPEAMDLTDRTTLFDVAALATRASVAVGNDSGVMHLISAVGCPSVVLTSPASNPGRYGPRGRYVIVVREENLADLPVTEVAAALRLG